MNKSIIESTLEEQLALERAKPPSILKRSIRSNHEGAVKLLGQSATKLILVGAQLQALKAKVKHGEWMPTLEELGISQPHASRLMAAAKRWDDLPWRDGVIALDSFVDVQRFLVELDAKAEAGPEFEAEIEVGAKSEDEVETGSEAEAKDEGETGSEAEPKAPSGKMDVVDRLRQRIHRAIGDLRETFDDSGDKRLVELIRELRDTFGSLLAKYDEREQEVLALEDRKAKLEAEIRELEQHRGAVSGSGEVPETTAEELQNLAESIPAAARLQRRMAQHAEKLNA